MMTGQKSLLVHFEPAFLDTLSYNDWEYNWNAFKQELVKEFSLINPETEAAEAINNLKRQENQHILKYNVAFNTL